MKLRLCAVAAATVIGLALGAGVAHAAPPIDDSNSMIAGNGDRVEVAQADTSVRSVPPLDGSPLTKEFFVSGLTAAKISGPHAQNLKGSKLTVGYEIGYPVALTGATIDLYSPSLGVSTGNSATLDIADLFGHPSVGGSLGVINGLNATIIPSQELEIALKPGGITDVPLLNAVPFDGNSASVRIADLHGSVQGAIGQVTLRPYAIVQTPNGDTIATYGKPIPL